MERRKFIIGAGTTLGAILYLTRSEGEPPEEFTKPPTTGEPQIAVPTLEEVAEYTLTNEDTERIENRYVIQNMDRGKPRKYRRIYSPELADFVFDEHKSRNLLGLLSHSLAYSYINTEFDPDMIERGGGMEARGIMDVQFTTIIGWRDQFMDLLRLPDGRVLKWEPGILNNSARVNIRAHCIEAEDYWNGNPMETISEVFSPRKPKLGIKTYGREWGDHVLLQEAWIKSGYHKKEIPTMMDRYLAEKRTSLQNATPKPTEAPQAYQKL